MYYYNCREFAAPMLVRELGLNPKIALIHLEKHPTYGKSDNKIPINAAFDKYAKDCRRMRIAILYV